MPVENTASPSVCPIAPNGVPVKIRPSSRTRTALFMPRLLLAPVLARRRHRCSCDLQPAVVVRAIVGAKPCVDFGARRQPPPNGQDAFVGHRLARDALLG